MARTRTKCSNPWASSTERLSDAVTEVELLLTDDQVKALQTVAESRRLTLDSLIRGILSDYLSGGRDQSGRTETRHRGSGRKGRALGRDFHAAALAHELWNALTPLAYGVAVIRRAGLESPGGREAFGWMDRQISHLKSVLEGMLELHRADRGKLVLRTRDVDLGEIADHAADAVGPLIQKRNHRLTVRVAPGARILCADPTRLEQVLVNLLTNAARYTDPGGEISLIAVRDGDWVTIRVRDTGVGILADLLPRVFDGFVQGDPERGGLGLGLALVRRLVELHGGRVGAASNGPGTGSEFVVNLPRGQRAKSPGRDLDQMSP